MYVLSCLVPLKTLLYSYAVLDQVGKVWKTNCFVSLVNRKSTQIFLIINTMKSRGIKLIAQKLCLFVWLSIQLVKM